MGTVIVITLVIVVPLAIICNNMRNKMLAEGRIINRDMDFHEKAEIFNIKKQSDFSQIIDGVMNFNYNDIRCSLDGDKNTQNYKFKGADWNARLWLVSNEEDETVYRFEFENWHQRNGIPTGGLAMNKLETAIEKMFLSIDSDTKVSTEKIEFKTRHSFL